MKLLNLKELVGKIQIKIKDVEFKDVILPDDFKEQYTNLLATQSPNGYKKIDWARYTAHVTTSTQKSIYISNFWFYLASSLADLIEALEEHKKLFTTIFTTHDLGIGIDVIAKDLKENVEFVEVYGKPIDTYFAENGISEEQKVNFIQFLSDYPAWGGGKTIDRNDYYVSPVLKCGNLLAETQSAIAELTHQLAHNVHIWDLLRIQIDEINQTQSNQPSNISDYSRTQIQLPKPFLLLAGISGTGKSRFVREQARMQSDNGDLSYLEQIAVRPDWHEPSDLLGYVSRIGGEHYVATPFLKFIAKAWRDAFASADADGFYTLNPEAKTHWICLDEMNLAPVEQYFADYLSLIETRKWRGGRYRCDAIFKPAELAFSEDKKSAALAHMANELGFKSETELALWAHFLSKGMPIPPNLIVAGTVNMDETTHGFSRKVIDRALTIDFGVFFPNDFSTFLAPTTHNKKICYSRFSDVEDVDLSSLKYTAADGTEVRMVDATITLMTEINAVVKGTPFELAYRALNEILVALTCYEPTDELTLHAVWDDFLMGKLLPRLEGDAEKMRVVDDKNSLLTQLSALLAKHLLSGDGQRPDLLLENKDGKPLMLKYRSLEKLDWMQKRLARDSFTSFWP